MANISSAISVSSKLLVGTGLTADGYTTEIEVIDLLNPGVKCQNLPNYPLETLSAVGTPYPYEAPLICGGHNATDFSSECYVLKEGSWTPAAALNTKR